MASRGAIRSGLGSFANAIRAKHKQEIEATERARQENLRLQAFQNNPELLSGPLRQPIPPARINRDRPFPPPGFIEETNVGPPLPRPGARQEIQARLQGLQKRQQENFKQFAIENEENAKIFSQLPADVSAKLATQLRTGRADSFARIKEQAGSFGSVAQQALSMKAGPRRNDFLIKDFETRQRLAESEGVQGPDAQRYLDIINAVGSPDLQNSLLKNIVGTNRDIEKLIASKETQDKDQLERDDFALSDVFKSAANMETIPREGQLSQQDFFLQNQRQAFIAEGNNRGVQEIDRMLKVPAGPDRALLMTSRGQQIEGGEVRKARVAPTTLSEGQRRFGPGGEEIARVAPKPDLTTLEKEAIAAGNIPGTPEFKEFIGQRAGRVRSGRFTKGTGVIVRDEQGSQFRSVPILDQNTGKLINKLVPIGGELVSRVGETPEELIKRQARGKGLGTAEVGRVGRLNTRVSEGITAAEGLATINRSLQLLEEGVKTGGFAGLKLKASQFLGVEGADQAELSANLARTVLSQLRPTFGAQFTEREGTKLERIEAGIGKSVAGNIRVLKQLKTIIEREARRGLSAAREVKDNFAIEEIDRLMKFKISSPTSTAVGGGEFNFNPTTGKLEPAGGKK